MKDLRDTIVICGLTIGGFLLMKSVQEVGVGDTVIRILCGGYAVATVIGSFGLLIAGLLAPFGRRNWNDYRAPSGVIWQQINRR